MGWVRLVFGIALCAFWMVASQAQETIHFQDGQSVTADVLQVSSSTVYWRTYPSGTTTTQTPIGKVDLIEFQPSEEWAEAENAFSRGDFAEAAKLYRLVAQNRVGHFYPATGNFSSLALRKMLDCRRRLLHAKQVMEVAQLLEKEWKTLPKGERNFTAVESAWIAAGKEDWEKVLSISEKAEATGADAVELSYLSGKAHLAKGEKEAAVDGFTAAYAFGFGSRPEIARNSLRTSAEIVYQLGDSDRFEEIHSQLKIYQELFGKGELWEGAPEPLMELAKADLETLKFIKEKAETEMAETEGSDTEKPGEEKSESEEEEEETPEAEAGEKMVAEAEKEAPAPVKESETEKKPTETAKKPEVKKTLSTRLSEMNLAKGIHWQNGGSFAGEVGPKSMRLWGTLVEAVNCGGTSTIEVVVSKDDGRSETIPFVGRNIFSDVISVPGPGSSDENWNKVINRAVTVEKWGTFRIKGLTPGQIYQIEFFVLDNRNRGTAKRAVIIADETKRASAPVRQGNMTSVVGTFKAKGEEKPFTIRGNANPVLNAYVLRKIPGENQNDSETPK